MLRIRESTISTIHFTFTGPKYGGIENKKLDTHTSKGGRSSSFAFVDEKKGKKKNKRKNEAEGKDSPRQEPRMISSSTCGVNDCSSIHFLCPISTYSETQT